MIVNGWENSRRCISKITPYLCKRNAHFVNMTVEVTLHRVNNKESDNRTCHFNMIGVSPDGLIEKEFITINQV